MLFLCHLWCRGSWEGGYSSEITVGERSINNMDQRGSLIHIQGNPDDWNRRCWVLINRHLRESEKGFIHVACSRTLRVYGNPFHWKHCDTFILSYVCYNVIRSRGWVLLWFPEGTATMEKLRIGAPFASRIYVSIMCFIRAICHLVFTVASLIDLTFSSSGLSRRDSALLLLRCCWMDWGSWEVKWPTGFGISKECTVWRQLFVSNHDFLTNVIKVNYATTQVIRSW